MKNFFWRGIDVYGREVSGCEQVEDERLLAERLLKKGIALLDTKKRFDFSYFFTGKIKREEKVYFFEYLHILLSSGLPLADSLTLVLKQIKHKNFKNVVLNLIEDLKAGYSFSVALKKYLGVFTMAEVSMIAAAENSGGLANSFKNIFDNLTKKCELIKKLKSAALLPVLTLIFSFFLILGIFVFVIPQFESIFTSFDKELPEATVFVFKISKLLRSEYSFFIFIVFLLFLLLIRFLLKLPAVKKIIDWLFFKTYFINKIFINYNLARFFESLAIVLDSGVDLKRALDISVETIDNIYIKKNMYKVKNDVIGGACLQYALQKGSNLSIPDDIIAFVGVGEKSGNLTLMLNNSAQYCSRLLWQKLNLLTVIFQPILLIFVGLIISLLLLSIYLPIFDMAMLT